MGNRAIKQNARSAGKSTRLKHYGRIHSLMAERDISDETYRDILFVNFDGATSKTDLSDLQLLTLVRHLEGINPPKGAKQTGGFPGRPRNMEVPDRADLMGKIEACLTERKLPWNYAKSMAKRICKKDALELCGPKDLLKIIAAFGYDAQRKGLRK